VLTIRPIVFISEAKKYYRIFGVVSDKTGWNYIWNPTELIKAEDEYWINYTGDIGCDLKGMVGEVSALCNQGWFNQENTFSTNGLIQFFLLLYKLFK